MEQTQQQLICNSSRRVYRHWSEALKRQIVAETKEPGISVSVVARRHDVNANQLFQWCRKYGAQAEVALAGFAPVKVAKEPVVCGAGLITIELRSGILVRVDRDVDQEALKRVMAAVGTAA